VDDDTLARTLAAYRSPRYCELDRLEAFVETTQYDGRSHEWLDGSENAPPLLERRPCIAYPIVRTAIDSNVDLCLGEGKFPAFSLTDGDDVEAGTGDAGIGDDQRKAVDTGLAKLIDLARLKQSYRQAMGSAQGQRTAVLIHGMRDGRPFVESEKAKRCTPTFTDDGTVASLDIRYVYTEDVRERDGRWRKVAKLYRRRIDAERDTVFAPVLAQPDGSEPKSWPEQSSIAHGLGFCPVVWYRHMAGCTTEGNIDGRAIHEHHLDELEALDRVLSQWHRAAVFAGDPQLFETGVDGESGPRARGRTALAEFSTPSGGAPSAGNPVNGRWGSPPTKARKKSPGEVWQYESPDVKVGLLTLPGDALKALQDHCRDLREKVSEGLGVVFSDPDTVRFASALSGKAQQMLRQRQLDRCDQYRDDMADGMIVPSLHMLLRIMRSVPPKSVALRRLVTATAALGEVPSITLRWGAYYEPDPEEQTKIARFLVEADKVIPLTAKMKLQKLARALDIENVDAALEEIEAEREDREEKAREIAESGANALLMAAHGPNGGGDRGGAGADPAANAGRGRRAPPPPAAKGAPVAR
jgi:hypothetical protein